MEGKEGSRASARRRAAAIKHTVQVRSRGHLLELTFPFRPDDVARVKAIPGRRWLRRRRVWVVPNTQRSVQALIDAFDTRLVVHGAPPGHRVGAGPDGLSVTHDPSAAQLLGEEGAELMKVMRLEIRTRDYSPKTERAYMGWVRRFFRFQARRAGATDPARLDGADVRAFLEHLTMERRLAAKSRNQAASALAFLFREILGRDDLDELPRAKGPRRLPTVLSHREVLRVLRELSGKHLLVVVLLYSAGLRLEECLQMRVKDVDFELRQILVRDGKGKKDRYVPLASRAVRLLRAQIQGIAELHEADRQAGQGWAPLPAAMHRKDPTAGDHLAWQFVFPARSVSEDPATGNQGRRSLHATAVQRQVKRAVRRSGLTKRVGCHTFRHSFATEALRGGCDVRTLQSVMGHKDIRTTMIYLHVVEQTGLHMRSPLDRPDDAEEDDWDPTRGR